MVRVRKNGGGTGAKKPRLLSAEETYSAGRVNVKRKRQTPSSHRTPRRADESVLGRPFTGYKLEPGFTGEGFRVEHPLARGAAAYFETFDDETTMLEGLIGVEDLATGCVWLTDAASPVWSSVLAGGDMVGIAIYSPCDHNAIIPAIEGGKSVLVPSGLGRVVASLSPQLGNPSGGEEGPDLDSVAGMTFFCFGRPDHQSVDSEGVERPVFGSLLWPHAMQEDAGASTLVRVEGMDDGGGGGLMMMRPPVTTHSVCDHYELQSLEEEEGGVFDAVRSFFGSIGSSASTASWSPLAVYRGWSFSTRDGGWRLGWRLVWTSSSDDAGRLEVWVPGPEPGTRGDDMVVQLEIDGKWTVVRCISGHAEVVMPLLEFRTSDGSYSSDLDLAGAAAMSGAEMASHAIAHALQWLALDHALDG